jgi:hypothetical protein
LTSPGLVDSLLVLVKGILVESPVLVW